MFSKIFDFVKSIPFRVAGNKNSTIGGGLFGVGLAALIGKIEEMTGCQFAIAFGNIDWLQLTGYVAGQVFGAMMTDANKTVPSKEQVVTPA